jgi:hypothetical protein
MKLLLPAQLTYNLSQRINQKLLKKPSLDNETYGQLLSVYEDDIIALQDLIGCDLSAWLGESLASEPPAKDSRLDPVNEDPATKRF